MGNQEMFYLCVEHFKDTKVAGQTEERRRDCSVLTRTAQVDKKALRSNVFKSIAKLVGSVQKGLSEPCELNGFFIPPLLLSRLPTQLMIQRHEFLGGFTLRLGQVLLNLA
ncbi:MAG: hypothetical protein QNJ87_11020 [Gammaproteobacteria bacterium]|nr:hypothetical protein [Gammaproteobacteria bacterium]MDJ0872285.1 hypothetical protein [Gammaproteobacteria bacterium]MDJ0891530.1 hypothetical protein [Gammaproteobacteria bacterium]